MRFEVVALQTQRPASCRRPPGILCLRGRARAWVSSPVSLLRPSLQPHSSARAASVSRRSFAPVSSGRPTVSCVSRHFRAWHGASHKRHRRGFPSLPSYSSWCTLLPSNGAPKNSVAGMLSVSKQMKCLFTSRLVWLGTLRGGSSEATMPGLSSPAWVTYCSP